MCKAHFLIKNYIMKKLIGYFAVIIGIAPILFISYVATMKKVEALIYFKNLPTFILYIICIMISISLLHIIYTGTMILLNSKSNSKSRKKQTCMNCRFNVDTYCIVGSYYAEKGMNKICYEGELWEKKP